MMPGKQLIDKEEVQLYIKCESVSAGELSEVLSGFSELFSLANGEMGNPPILVRINDLKISSIEINSILELWSDTKAMVLGSDAQAILSIVGLISICKKIFTDIQSIKKGICSGCEYALKPLKKIVSVISDKDSFVRIKNSEKEVIISEKDANLIRTLKEDDVFINETESKQYYSIFSLTFRRGEKGFNKWKLADGDNIFSATIEDEDFLNLINEQNLPIRRNDILLCKVRTVQYQSSSGIRTETIVQKVLEYKHSPEQQDLNFEVR